MELLAVLLGGLLTLAGSYAAQRRAEQVRATEARVARFEAFRSELSTVVVEVDTALETFREHTLRFVYVPGETVDDKYERAFDTMNCVTLDVRRTLLQSSIKVPSGSPDRLASLIDQLRRQMHDAFGACWQYALDQAAGWGSRARDRPVSDGDKERRERAIAALDAAQEQLEELIALAREAFQVQDTRD